MVVYPLTVNTRTRSSLDYASRDHGLMDAVLCTLRVVVIFVSATHQLNSA